MEKNKRTQGEWHLNNPTNNNGEVIIKTNPQYGDQKYFSISIKHSFNVVGFYYPHSLQSDEEMIANAKIICEAVNNYDKLKEEKEYAEVEGKRLSEVATHWQKECERIKQSLELFRGKYFSKDGNLTGHQYDEITEIIKQVESK